MTVSKISYGKAFGKFEYWKIKLTEYCDILFKKMQGKKLIVFFFMFFILVKDNFIHTEYP